MMTLTRFFAIPLTGLLLLGISLNGAFAADTDSASELTAKYADAHSIETGQKISGIAIIPATGHRGSAKLAVAHADGGAALYGYDGTVLWRDDSPARLVGFFQGKLIIYRDHEETTRLDTYIVSDNGAAIFQSTAAPSPIAATTIQRTAFSVVGPVRVRENIVVINDKEIEMIEPVSAFAAAKQFIPITAMQTHVFALESGKILITEID